ncbi:zinc finger protein 91-like [Atheta coriaria]|uniref:zinc finger protein 91-like n=1 Tax=Dalotia coriaria TaxID=877792 RepID=UPI0031F473F0
MNECELNFTKICRCCKREEVKMISIFDDNIESIHPSIPAMLLTIASLNVQQNDGLPSLICKTCINKVQNAYTFRQQLIKTEAELWEILKQQKEVIIEEKSENIVSFLKSLLRKNVENDEPTGDPPNVDQPVTYFCDKCDTGYSHVTSLQRHMKSLHDTSIIYECKSCNAIIASKENLKVHIHLHEKSFCCENCKLIFNSLPDLHAHLCSSNTTNTSVDFQKIEANEDIAEYFTELVYNEIETLEVECDPIYLPQNLTEIDENINLTNIKAKDLKEHILQKRKIFACKLCGCNFARFYYMQRHLRTHLKQNVFRCAKCNRTYSRHEKLLSHSKSCKGETIFACDICNRTFKRAENLMCHKEIHSNSTISQIKTLTEEDLQGTNAKQFYSWNYVSVDNNTLTIENADEESAHSDNDIEDTESTEKKIKLFAFVCDICNVEFGCLEKLEEHHLLHHNLPNVVDFESTNEDKTDLTNGENTSDNCDVTAEPKDVSDEELVMKIEIEDDEIQNIPKQDESDGDYLPNARTKRTRKRRPGRPKKIKPEETEPIGKFTCPVCNETFERISHLESHGKEFHADYQVLKCSQCDGMFSRVYALNRHMQLHKIDVDATLLAAQAENRERLMKERRHECEKCLKRFTTKQAKQFHMKKHADDENFVCHKCFKPFLSKSNLMEHLQFHDKTKKFLCSECGQSFTRNDYLIIHMRRHRGEKPYTCKYCGKGFPRGTDLKVHERYHTGEKTHLCVVCGHGFNRAYNLTVHMRTHTGEKPYKCRYCDSAFAQCNDLKSHIRRHTGERFQCDLCSLNFIMGYELIQHKRKDHAACVFLTRKMTESNLNFAKICRCCKREEVKMVAIFNVDIETTHPPIPEILMTIASLNVEENDGLPSLICKPCINNIQNAYNFRQQLIKIESELREILEEKKSNGLVNFLASLLSKSVENNEPVEVCSDVDLSKGLWYKNKNLKPEPNISAKYESQSCEDNADGRLEDHLNNSDDMKTLDFKLHHNQPKITDCESTNEDETYLASGENTNDNYDVSAETKDISDEELVMKIEIEDDEIQNITKQDESDGDYLPNARAKRTRKRRPGRPKKIKPEEKEQIGKFPCPLCNETFERMLQLESHGKEVHPYCEVFKCPHCDKRFSRVYTFNRHRKVHVDVDASLLAAQAKNRKRLKNERRYKCEKCPKRFTSKQAKQFHLMRHPDDGNFFCLKCFKPFLSKSNLIEHMKCHGEVKPFVCSECGLSFIRNDHLNTHMKRHIGTRPNLCRYCGRGFPRDTDLKAHEGYHTGEKTHICTICGMNYSRAYCLTLHMRIHTGENPYKCEYCDAQFTNPSSLTKHKRRRHV